MEHAMWIAVCVVHRLDFCPLHFFLIAPHYLARPFPCSFFLSLSYECVHSTSCALNTDLNILLPIIAITIITLFYCPLRLCPWRAISVAARILSLLLTFTPISYPINSYYSYLDPVSFCFILKVLLHVLLLLHSGWLKELVCKLP